MSRREFSTASREPIDVELDLLSGAIPTDWGGFVFINSACGTVNSGGLPYPDTLPDLVTKNEEYGTPLIAGDGVVIRLDLSQNGKVRVKTGLMKPPCYYADLATSPASDPTNKYSELRFKNIGLGRRSLKLGTRNQLSTAVVPIKMGPAEPTRLLATFDAGRPFEFDPASLDIKTPITFASVWKSFLPGFMRTPFESIMSTAHPIFDAETKELYTVNFGKKRKDAFLDYLLFKIMIEDELKLKQFLQETMDRVAGSPLAERIPEVQGSLENFLISSSSAGASWFTRIFDRIKRWFLNLVNKLLFSKNGLYLIRWNGAKEVKKWQIREEGNKQINIGHNMHQIGLSRDFIVLCDTNFKFTFDTMMDLPFRDADDICAFFRSLLSIAMNDFSWLYIVKRADLTESADVVIAKKIRLDVETVHFSIEYENPAGEITLHSAHNCSACVADWLRAYDRQAVDPTKRVPEEKLGLLAVGEMDVSKVGKIVVNGNSGTLIPEKTIFRHFDGIVDGQVTGAHTWGIGLYTHRDILSAETNLPTIDHVYWQSYGLAQDRLTIFIHNLYRDSNRTREFSPQEVFNLTEQGAPMVLQCVSTSDMVSEDFFAFGHEQYFWSLQFVPKTNPTPGVPPSKNGYILTTVADGQPFGTAVPTEYDYQPQVWIFDANNLSGGPIAKLGHPSFSFGFTIHSVWVSQANAVPNGAHHIDVRDDYGPILDKVRGRRNRKAIKELFESHVYPNF